MHEKSREQLARSFEGVLKSIPLVDGVADFTGSWPHLDALARHVVKETAKSGLGEREAQSLVFSRVISYAPGRKDEQFEGLRVSIWDYLKDRAASERDAFVNFVESIPRRYLILFPMPSRFPVSDDLRITDRISVVWRSDVKQQTGMFGALNALVMYPRLPFLQIAMEGYCDAAIEGATLKQAMTVAKASLQQLLAAGLLHYAGDLVRALATIGESEHRVPKLEVTWVDLADDKQGHSPIPIELSRFLSALQFHESSHKLVEAQFSAALKRAAMICERTELEAEPVRAAMEWAIDASATENQTIRFLQICIALEAILGEEAPSEGLTKTLADRCAYLVSKDIRRRRAIREDFQKLYGARSKLVHGRRRSLHAAEAVLLEWGERLLQEVIDREIDNFVISGPGSNERSRA